MIFERKAKPAVFDLANAVGLHTSGYAQRPRASWCQDSRSITIERVERRVSAWPFVLFFVDLLFPCLDFYYYFVILFILICFFLQAVCGSLLKKPDNIAVIVGSDAIFECSTNVSVRQNNISPICWHYSSNLFTPLKTILFDGKLVSSEFNATHKLSVDDAVVRSILTLNRVRLSDNGYYTCKECLAPSTSSMLTADLIIVCKYSTLLFHSKETVNTSSVINNLLGQ